MKTAHGWECVRPSCRAYNAIHFTQCRCGAPKASGNLLYATLPVVVEQLPPPIYHVPPRYVPASPPAQMQVPGWVWGLTAIICFAVFVTVPALCLVGLFFALLGSIAAGIWRLANRH